MKVSLYYCDIEEVCTDSASFAELLCDHEREQAMRYRRDADRLRFCIGRALLRNLLAPYMACPAGQIPIQLSARGKPFVRGGPSFNLSHSHSIVFAGIASGCDIGVDVEHVRYLSDLRRLAHSCFSDREIRDFDRREGNEATMAFFRGWTRKEALVKALGNGLYQDLRSISVSMDVETTNALLEFNAVGDADAQWSVVPVELPGHYVAAVAANVPSFDIEVQKVDSLFASSERFCGADHSAEYSKSVGFQVCPDLFKTATYRFSDQSPGIDKIL